MVSMVIGVNCSLNNTTHKVKRYVTIKVVSVFLARLLTKNSCCK